MIKECSSCGSLYNKGYCCTPDSSQQPLRDCPKCGNPVEDLLNTYESSDDDTNVVNAPQDPFVVKQDPMAGHAAYTDRFHELARLVPNLVTLESRKIERYVNGSIKKVEKRGNVREPSKDKNSRNDNKRTRTGNAFATTANPVRRENTGAWPKCTTSNSYHAPEGTCRTCFNCNRPGHFTKDCRVVPRNVNPINIRNPAPARETCYECGSTDHLKQACPRLNRAQGPGGNRPNQIVANNGGQGRGNQWNQARGRAFILRAKEAHQDLNIVT
ncbi:putative reverse transcriptase domain-containing protein, partial [Tanacetum coccineum]